MKLLVSGQQGCDKTTFKKLLLLTDHIAFLDRPSVSFNDWGMIGSSSPFRQLLVKPSDPVKISIHRTPGGPADKLILKYLEPDVANPEFRRVFLNGLRDTRFASKFYQPTGKYQAKERVYEGSEIVQALLSDESLRAGDLRPIFGGQDPDEMFDVSRAEARRKILARELMVASVQVTAAMLVSEQTGCIPIADEPYFGQLISLRTSDPRYIGGTGPATPYLGLEIVSAVIPEEALEKLSLVDVYEFRNSSKDIYEAWMIELNALAASLDEMSPEQLTRDFPKLMATEFRPKIAAYENELRSVRDKLFSSLVKDVTKWQLPTVSLATFSEQNAATAIVAFAGLIKGAIPHLVDYYAARRELGRKHAISYVLGLTKRLKNH